MECYRVYKTQLISTIVDRERKSVFFDVYKTQLISTIVDRIFVFDTLISL